MIAIKPERVLADLAHLRSIGSYKTGVHRPTLSAEDIAARRWLLEQLTGIGYEATIDGIANVVGYAPGSGPRILAGSHLESQNHAGWLDGALGVVYALEAARAIKQACPAGGAAVDVIAFADEEGHFGGYLGSRSYVGEVDEAEIDAARDRTHGTPMREALAAAGLAGSPRLKLQPDRHRAFIEAHIEQGDWLERHGLAVAVVTSIVAIWQYRLEFEGEQNHAGTTRMAARKDAGVALTRLCQAVESQFRDVAGPRSVWTTGRITLEPGAPSVIPGRAEMLFQIRDDDRATLDRMEARLADIVAEENARGPCRVTLHSLRKSIPAAMAPEVQAAFAAAAEAVAPGLATPLPSGAGHDAQVLARHLPSGMLFVPSIGGVSHHWTENTSDADIVRGAQIFAEAAARLLA